MSLIDFLLSQVTWLGMQEPRKIIVKEQYYYPVMCPNTIHTIAEAVERSPFWNGYSSSQAISRLLGPSYAAINDNRFL